MRSMVGFCRNGLFMGLVCGLLSIVFMGGDARAGVLQIRITDGTTTYDILDEGPLDTLLFPPADNINRIQALAAALVFPDYKIVSLDASSNNPGEPNPDGAVLTMGAHVQRLTSGSGPDLVIEVTQTEFTSTGGLPGILSSSFGNTFTNAPTGDTRTFTSWYNPSDVEYATDEVQGLPVPLSYSSTGLALNSFGATAEPIGVSGAASFGLTNRTVITLSGVGADFVGGGSTQVLAIPEPTSVSLMAIGLTLTVWSLRRRRAPRAA